MTIDEYFTISKCYINEFNRRILKALTIEYECWILKNTKTKFLKIKLDRLNSKYIKGSKTWSIF